MDDSKIETVGLIRAWLAKWNAHDLEGVIELLHDNIVFENWTGAAVTGRSALRRSWAPWFNNHRNFKFIEEDIFIDEQGQKALLRWKLEWPSQGKLHTYELEIRRGVDVLHFLDGKIYRKYTYSKTNVQINSAEASQDSSNKDCRARWEP